jgi:hypothetical protein
MGAFIFAFILLAGVPVFWVGAPLDEHGVIDDIVAVVWLVFGAGNLYVGIVRAIREGIQP